MFYFGRSSCTNLQVVFVSLNLFHPDLKLRLSNAYWTCPKRQVFKEHQERAVNLLSSFKLIWTIPLAWTGSRTRFWINPEPEMDEMAETVMVETVLSRLAFTQTKSQADTTQENRLVQRDQYNGHLNNGHIWIIDYLGSIVCFIEEVLQNLWVSFIGPFYTQISGSVNRVVRVVALQYPALYQVWIPLRAWYRLKKCMVPSTKSATAT